MNDLGGPEIRGSCAHMRAEAVVSAPDTKGKSEGTTRVLSGVEARSDKVKISVEHQRGRCKETKVYEPQILGALQRGC